MRSFSGLIAVYLANAYIGRGDQRVADAQVGTTKVAVAAIPLDYGTDLTPDKVKFVDYPSASLPTGIFSNYNQLAPAGKRRVVLRPIALNEPILATKLAGEGLGPSIAYLLPDGMRAAAVRINDVSGVAGFVQPMDTVDVLITRQASAEGNRQVTDVLLQNIRVIAIDQNAQGRRRPAGHREDRDAGGQSDGCAEARARAATSASSAWCCASRRRAGPRPVETVSLEDLRYSYYGGERHAGGSGTPVQLGRGRPSRAHRAASSSVARRRSSRGRRTSKSSRGTTGSNYEVGGYGA